MNIFRELNRYARGSGDEQSLDKIFVYCNELAVNHINSLKLSSQLTAFQGSSNDCIKDQASNYLSHLWCPPDEQGLAPIAKIWKNILIKTNNHREDALFYLSNTIRDIVAKKRIEALRTSRPQEWKLRRNIRLIVGRLEHYSIARTDGKLLIVSKSNTGQEIVSISRKILERHCYRLFEVLTLSPIL